MLGAGSVKRLPGPAGTAAIAAAALAFAGAMMWPEVQTVFSAYSNLGGVVSSGVYPFVLFLLAIPLFAYEGGRLSFEGASLVRLVGLAVVAWTSGLGRLLLALPSAEVVMLSAAVFGALLTVYPRIYVNWRLFLAVTGLATLTALSSTNLFFPLASAYANLAVQTANLLRLTAVATGPGIFILGTNGPTGLLIGDACIGVAASAVFLMMLAVLTRELSIGRKRAIKIGIVGVAGIQLVNLARLLLTILVGSSSGGLTMAKYHEVSGYLLFGAYFTAVAVFLLWNSGQRMTHRRQVTLRFLVLALLFFIILASAGTVVAGSISGTFTTAGCTGSAATFSVGAHVYASAVGGGTTHNGKTYTWSFGYLTGGVTAQANAGQAGAAAAVTTQCDAVGFVPAAAGTYSVTYTNSDSFQTGGTDSALGGTFTVTTAPDFGLGGLPVLAMALLIVVLGMARRRS